jgi:MinD-like ATPase involved in chromosome partitioning or flagellar assembly
MRQGRFSILALARPRSTWLAELTRWSGSGVIGTELIRCVSTDEVRARLTSLQQFSAVMFDEHSLGLDRDLLATCTDAACASIVVTSGLPRRDWISLGADRIIDSSFGSDELLSTLRAVATPIEQCDKVSAIAGSAPNAAPVAPLIAVTGGGGTGRSTVAIALAQALPGSALLDGALDASLALMIGGIDIVPALQELVEAHRTGVPTADEVRTILATCDRHGFDLLPGLRRHRDWTTLRPRAVEASVRSLRQAYPVVIADIDADIEGESDTGSFDIADRNSLARIIAGTADAIVVTGRSDLSGLSRLVSTVATLIDFGIEPGCITPVVLRPTRSILSPAEIRRSVSNLLERVVGDLVIAATTVVELPRDLDTIVLDGAPMPAPFVEQLRRLLPTRLEHASSTPDPIGPVPIVSGELGIAS